MTTPFDFEVDKRKLPSQQEEFLPVPPTPEVASSYRSNFFPASVDLNPTNDLIFNKYILKNTPSTPLFSPVFQHVPSIPLEKLRMKGPTIQELRRKLMRNANVLIIQGGYSGKKFIYDRLKELKVNVTIMDGPESFWKQEYEAGNISHFLEIDFADNDTIFERAMQVIDESGLHFDACTTYYENAVALAARIARALCVETNPPEACDKARNKHTTRKVMAECGLQVPRFFDIKDEDSMVKAAKEMNGRYPAILKPVFGAASFGVVKCENEEEAINSYHKIKKSLNKEVDVLWAQGTDMVLEEYYDGDEFDVDILLSEGVAVYAKVSDNFACWEPYFQETGTCCPSMYPPEKQQELINLAVSTTLALGFRWGCFHVELKYTSHGPRLIEVNARMGGVGVRDCNLKAWGVDLVEEHCMTALKIPICPDVPETPVGYFVEIAINTPYSGTVTSNGSWITEKLQSETGKRLTTYYDILKKKDAKVTGPEDGMPDWLADVRFCSDRNMEEVLDFVIDLIFTQLKGRVPVKPNDPKQKKEFFFPSNYHPFVRKLS